MVVRLLEKLARARGSRHRGCWRWTRRGPSPSACRHPPTTCLLTHPWCSRERKHRLGAPAEPETSLNVFWRLALPEDGFAFNCGLLCTPQTGDFVTSGLNLTNWKCMHDISWGVACSEILVPGVRLVTPAITAPMSQATQPDIATDDAASAPVTVVKAPGDLLYLKVPCSCRVAWQLWKCDAQGACTFAWSAGVMLRRCKHLARKPSASVSLQSRQTTGLMARTMLH